MQGDPHGPPSSQACVSVKSDVVTLEQPPSQVRVLVRMPFPQVTLQVDQSDHSANTIASEYRNVNENRFQKYKVPIKSYINSHKKCTCQLLVPTVHWLYLTNLVHQLYTYNPSRLALDWNVLGDSPPHLLIHILENSLVLPYCTV